MAETAMVGVDYEAVGRLATSLRALPPLPQDEEEPTRVALPADVVKNFYFALVAICHQTTPVNGPALTGWIEGREHRGWDYLRERFLRAAQADPELVFPKALAKLSGSNIRTIFRDERCGETLTDVDGRAQLLRSLGSRMTAAGYATVQALYDSSDGRLAGVNPPGLLSALQVFEAYSDPVCKKSIYFLSLMANHRLWTYRDPTNLGAPVDYHEVRGHLRIGTVRLMDSALRRKVELSEAVDAAEDIQIRKAVFEAIRALSELTGYTPTVLHYLFWNVFRSCCSRSDTHCDSCPTSCALPPRYALIRSLQRCAFADACASAGAPEKLVEHRVMTHFY